jgi:CRP/FNR family cyclic AMP-dependent transcriptional regulator
VDHVGALEIKTWCLTEVDIFCDLSATEMDAIAAAAPMRTYAAGELIYSPHNPVETLFIRTLTTAIIIPGTIFGEMVLLGQHMYDSFAEALDETVVCVMSRADVQRFLLSDPRIAGRIAETLGKRLIEMERRLSESVFKSVPQRVASTVATLASQQRTFGFRSRDPVVTLTHEQIAALAGTSRETTTKVLGDLADRGVIRLGRGRITVLDRDGIDAEAGG